MWSVLDNFISLASNDDALPFRKRAVRSPEKILVLIIVAEGSSKSTEDPCIWRYSVCQSEIFGTGFYTCFIWYGESRMYFLAEAQFREEIIHGNQRQALTLRRTLKWRFGGWHLVRGNLHKDRFEIENSDKVFASWNQGWILFILFSFYF